MKKTIFITGATGNIGARLVSQILTDEPTANLIVLVRGKSTDEAREKLTRTLLTADPDVSLTSVDDRVDIVRGDITREDLGLTQTTYEYIASRVTHVIHSAASTKFNVSLSHARLSNVTGTMNVMRLALAAKAHGQLRGVAYVSTAFVCGERPGHFFEDDLNETKTFSSTYDRTKWEAEAKVRALRPQLPITIFRPSIVVGDSRTGRIVSYNVLYTPLRYIGMGAVKIIAGSPNVVLDVVPVDYVTRAISHIFLKSDTSTGKTYNLVSGKERSLTTSQITGRAVSLMKIHGLLADDFKARFLPSVLLRSVKPLLANRTGKMLERLKEFEPHIKLKREFDNTNTRAALDGTDIEVPSLGSYIDTILTHWLKTVWGSRLRRAA